MSQIDWQALEAAAIEARKSAYCPYSRYAVGAAILGDDGAIYSGCNVENVSYGASLCAERNAVTRMVCEGTKRIRALALMTADGGTPCGMCLQVLSEFVEEAEPLPIRILSESGGRRDTSLHELLPQPFANFKAPDTNS